MTSAGPFMQHLEPMEPACGLVRAGGSEEAGSRLGGTLEAPAADPRDAQIAALTSQVERLSRYLQSCMEEAEGSHQVR